MGMDWSDEPDPSHDPDTGIDDGGFDSLGDDMLADSESEFTDDVDSVDDGELDAVEDDDVDVTDDVDDSDAEGDDQLTPDTVAAADVTDEEIVGTDPDASQHQDDPAFIVEFPPELDLDPRPEPIDGEPWSDSSLLGDTEESGTDWMGTDYAASLDGLLAMDGGGADSNWDNLLSSSDPAVASLARWWQP